MTNQEFIESISLPNEEWRDVVGYEGYYMVSSLGRVISLGRYVTRYHTKKYKPAIMLKCNAKHNNYKKVTFNVDGEHRTMDVHRIVSIAFLPNPNNYPQVDHINGDKHCNEVSNLRWCNDEQNSNNPITRTNHRKSLIEKTSPFAPVKIVGIKNDNTIVVYETMCEAKHDGYSQSMISECCNGNRKHHKGMRWMRYSDYERSINKSKNP